MLERAGHQVVQFDGPLLELMTESRTRFDQRLEALGPDVLADEFAFHLYIARLRSDDPTRGIGDALLDQRNLAGIGNLWKAEGLWESARTGDQDTGRRVFRRHGQPCDRCGVTIRARGQGDDNRTTFWCPGCQR